MRSPWALLLSALLASGCLSFHRGAMPLEPSTATYTQLGNTRVRYAVSGDSAQTVVLIHGFASSLETWENVASELGKTHRVVSLDLRGFGWTDRPETDYSPAAQAKLVFELMDHLKVERATVVGHSWGASIALQMALSAPKRVERLALYDAWVYEEQLPTTFKWARVGGLGELIWAMFYKERTDEKIELGFYDPERFVTETLVEKVERALERPGTTAAALAAVRGQDFTKVQARYPAVTQPTLLLWGEADRVARLEFGRRLLEDLPNARLLVFPRCGHFPMIEAHTASTTALAEFLRSSP